MNYHKIQKADISNGTSWGVVIWLSGCEHHCNGCFNQETWNKDSGKKFDDEAKQRFFNSISNPQMKRVTLTGGDPLYCYNRKEVIELCKEIKQTFPTKTIWLYSGYTYEEIKQDVTMSPVLDYIDVLVDGEYIQDLKDSSLEFRGSKNQRVIDVKSGENIF